MTDVFQATIRLIVRLPGQVARLSRVAGRSSAPGRLAAAVGRIVGHARAGRRNVVFPARPGGTGARAVASPASASGRPFPATRAGHAAPASIREMEGYATPRGDGRGLPVSLMTMVRRADAIRPATTPLPAFSAHAQAAVPATTHMPARAIAMPWTGRVMARADTPHMAIPASWGRTGPMMAAIMPQGRTLLSPVTPSIMARNHASDIDTPHIGRSADGAMAFPMLPVRAASGAALPLHVLRADGTPAGMGIPAPCAMTRTTAHTSNWPVMPMPHTMPTQPVPARSVPPFPASLPSRDRGQGRPPFISQGPMERAGGLPSSIPDGRRSDRLPVMQVTIPVTLDHQTVGQAMARVETAAARHELRATGTAPDVIRYPQMPGRAVGV
ncbi:hypothetical protein [Komagataeibacter diospyri]|uniref:hypothetical protein n=1 Tax=Komagataeibacter diospyri TaxID=1932662 RepID=UPI003756AF21